MILIILTALVLISGIASTYVYASVQFQDKAKADLLQKIHTNAVSRVNLRFRYLSKARVGFDEVTKVKFVINDINYIVVAQNNGYVSLLKLGSCWGSVCIRRLWSKKVADQSHGVYGINIPSYSCYGSKCLFVFASGHYLRSGIVEYKLFDESGTDILFFRSNESISKLLGYAVALDFVPRTSTEPSLLRVISIAKKVCSIDFELSWSFSKPRIKYYSHCCFRPSTLSYILFMTTFKYLSSSKLVLANRDSIALYTQCGQKLWSYHLPSIYGDIVKVDAGGNLIAVGTNRGYVLLLRSSDGYVIWKSKLFKYVAIPSISDDDKILVAISPFDKRIIVSNAFSGGYTLSITINYEPMSVDVVRKNSVVDTLYYLVAIGSSRGWVYEYIASLSGVTSSESATTTSTSSISWQPPSWRDLGCISLSRSISSYVSSSHSKWYGFRVYRSGNYVISLSAIGSSDPDLYVYNDEGNLIKKSNEIGSDNITLYLRSGRYYFIKVYGYNGGSFVLTIRRSDAYVTSTLSSLTTSYWQPYSWADLGYVYSSKSVNSYVSSGHSKWYGFKVSSSGYYTISVGGSGDPDLYIYDYHGTLIKKSNTAGDDCVTLYLRSGRYYFIKIYGYRSSHFTLTIKKYSASSTTISTTASTITTSSGSWYPSSWINLGYVYSSKSISSYVSRGSAKWYGFKVYRSGNYTIYVSGSGDPDLYVYNSNGYLIKKSTKSGSDSVCIYLSSGSRYFIKVYGYRSGYFTLTIRRNYAYSTTSTSTTTISSGSWHPPTSWIYLGRIYLSKSISSYITSGQMKWYGFKVYRSGYYVVSVRANGNSDPDLYIYNDRGVLIGRSKSFGSDSVTIYLREGHYYYVMIFGYKGGSYDLAIRRSR